MSSDSIISDVPSLATESTFIRIQSGRNHSPLISATCLSFEWSNKLIIFLKRLTGPVRYRPYPAANLVDMLDKSYVCNERAHPSFTLQAHSNLVLNFCFPSLQVTCLSFHELVRATITSRFTIARSGNLLALFRPGVNFQVLCDKYPNVI
jgi:hypothetical protein